MLRAALSLCVPTHTIYTSKDPEASGSWKGVCQHLCSGVEHVRPPAGAVQGGQPGELGSTANSRQVGEGAGRNTRSAQLAVGPVYSSRSTAGALLPYRLLHLSAPRISHPHVTLLHHFLLQ